MEPTQFSHLTIQNWKQFRHVDISFHKHLTVLTGANGSGKTTILNLLAKHFGWNHIELATPAKDIETGLFRYFTRFFKRPFKGDELTIGKLLYNDKSVARLIVPDADSPQYSISIENQKSVQGLSIPSHRQTFFYQPVSQIHTARRSKIDAFNLTTSSVKSMYQGGGGQTSNFYIKETLLNWAIGGAGNEFIEPDGELRANFLGFQKILRKVLPESLGFRELTVRKYEIVLITNSGDFMLDAVSGGITAIVDLAWQIFTSLPKSDEFITILIDEIENHLHPAMQRSILPSFLKAFPNVQFIVTSHSPLIVGSVANSNVFAFRQEKIGVNYRFYSERLDLVNKAKSASEILDEVLGVPFTMPIWVEDLLSRLVEKYGQSEVDGTAFQKMREELKSVGLEELMPEAIKKTLRQND